MPNGMLQPRGKPSARFATGGDLQLFSRNRMEMLMSVPMPTMNTYFSNRTTTNRRNIQGFLFVMRSSSMNTIAICWVHYSEHGKVFEGGTGLSMSRTNSLAQPSRHNHRLPSFPL